MLGKPPLTAKVFFNKIHLLDGKSEDQTGLTRDDWMIRQFAIEFAMHAIVGVGLPDADARWWPMGRDKRGEETLVGQFVLR